MDLFERFQFKLNLLKNYNYLDLIIIFLIFLFFVTILWNTSVAKNCYTLLALIALYLLATRQLTIYLFRLEKYFLWSIAASFIWVVVTYFINGMPEKGGTWILNRQLRLLLIIPIYLMLRSRPIPAYTWWYILGIGSIVAGLVGISGVFWRNGLQIGRATGDTSAIFFGGISLCMAFMALIGIKKYYSKGKLKAVFLFFAVCLGLLAMILSGTRTAWLAIPFLFIITSLYLINNISLNKKIIVLMLLSTFPILFFQVPSVQNRYLLAKNNIGEYLKSNNITDPVHNSSTGIRLDIWKVMLTTIKENPIFGVGIGGFKDELNRHIQNGVINTSIGVQPHSHNQYIEISVYSGILGLILNICMLIFPAIIFYKYAKRDNCNNGLAQPYAVSGMLLVTAYLLFGLTDLTLTRKVPIMFFGLSISILLSLVYQNKKNNRNPLEY